MPEPASKILPLCRKLLKARGYRLTNAREAVLGILADAEIGAHLSAEDIYRMMQNNRLSVGLTSIYRSLDLLVNLGIADRFDFGDGRARYELAEGPRGVPHHHHLVCDNCGIVIDYHEFTDEELRLIKRTEERLSEKYGFRITGHVIKFHGLCSACKRFEE
ncbi:MAG: Fur family transcriptional regulator [Thermodesulfobacteriota bacterium]